jgi:hypothetical protein
MSAAQHGGRRPLADVVAVRLAAFAVVLLVAFAAAFAVGRSVGPVGDDGRPHAPATTTTTMADMDHGGH